MSNQTKAPRCLNCGARIPKRQSFLYLRSEAQAARGLGGRDWLTVPKLPKTIEEAQRLTNWRVKRVDRLLPGQAKDGDEAGDICSLYGWDGESYRPRYGHFCTIRCGADFGRTMANRGARL